MKRRFSRRPTARLSAHLAWVILALTMPSMARALPILSEVLYDAAGSDDGSVFVEIFGTPGESLDGLFVEGINGAGGGITASVALVGVIPVDGFFVLADATGSGVSFVPDADQLANFDFQNGPDSIVLRSASSVLDALGYGAFGPGDVFAGEGTAAADPPAGSSLARRFSNLDTGDNGADFLVVGSPTPGSGPLHSIPEPAVGLLWTVAGLRMSRAIRRGTVSP